MRLFSYVVARDYGFAPNPFFGVCTLATCKPEIRRLAMIGDWIVGTGSRRRGRQGAIVYAMEVTETMTFCSYWQDGRFRRKRPNLCGSMKQAFGDNIYFRDDAGRWRQLDSHHSYADGTPNLHNITRDTGVDRVVIGRHYAYWGGAGPFLPDTFRSSGGFDICARRGYKSRFPRRLVEDFVTWFRSLNASGFCSPPLEWTV